MKKPAFLIWLLLISLFAILPLDARAEDKPPSEQIIPKLPTTPNDPLLTEAHVYPFWGPVCQRYTYSVIYQDKEGRPPEYVRIYFNGDWMDIEKENPQDNDYKNGVKYIYKFVPQKIDSNFYFFEASNGLGKARAGIIDSPDNGPVLFASSFDNNEIALIDAVSGEKIWSFPTGKEWVGGVALSDDGKNLAAKTSQHIYLFETGSNEPLWVYQTPAGGMIGDDVNGGIDISADGGQIFAQIGCQVLFFSRKSNQPLWQDDIGNSAYNAAISANGEYMAVAAAGDAEKQDTNLIILWNKKGPERLWQYHSSGNFHDVSLSADGQFIAAATGCPDRRAYLFSKDSNQPLWRSEMLTRDSPVHQAKISADGGFAAFGAECDDGAVHLFSKEANQVIWKFSAPGGNSFRALGITSDGKYIGGATLTSGDAYIFSSDSATPMAHWNFDASLGAADIADDGSFLAIGGTDKKVHILERESQKERATVGLNEFVGEIDVSANGRLVAAGTSGSVYFFESLGEIGPAVECEKIIEPEPESIAMSGLDKENEPIQTLCGDGECGGPETPENCPRDCRPDQTGSRDIDSKNPLPTWLWVLGGVGLVSLLGLGGYFVFVKFKKSRQQPPPELPESDITQEPV